MVLKLDFEEDYEPILHHYRFESDNYGFKEVIEAISKAAVSSYFTSQTTVEQPRPSNQTVFHLLALNCHFHNYIEWLILIHHSAAKAKTPEK